VKNGDVNEWPFLRKGFFFFNKGLHMRLMKAGVFMIMMLGACATKAQIVKDPTTWMIETKKTGANTFDVIFHLKLQPTWHIWSLNPGGDGFQVAPEFKMSGAKMNGKVKEKGKLVKGKVDGIDGIVNYYSGSVDYVQSVTGAAGAKVSGSYKYQVCTDEMCLPPKTKKFEVTLK
jgi:thiol:disulfide interchange protein DsbD